MNLAPYRDETPPLREILGGGAVLLSKEIETAHSVALGVWLRTGSEDEPPQLGGLSHFLEHIVFKGSRRRSAFEIASGFDALGASVDAFTAKDHVGFALKVLPEYFEPACEMLADMLLHPALAPEMIALEQDVVCEEIQEALDTPEDRLHDAFCARLYGDHGRGRPILGSAPTVRALDREALRREHARLFRGSNLVVSLAGNLPRGARGIVRRHFAAAGPGPEGGAGAAAGSATAAAGTAAGTGAAAGAGTPVGSGAVAGAAAGAVAGMAAGTAAPAGGGRLELNGPVVQTYFEIGNRAISFRHPDRIRLLVTSNILGGGMSSRVFQAVREREGLAYTIYNYLDMGPEVGLVSCAGSCSPAKAPRLEEIVRLEYARLIREGVPATELESNRAQIKSQLLFSLEGVSNQMARAAKNEIYYGRFLPVAELVDQIDGVGEGGVVECARRFFDPHNLTIATHGPSCASESVSGP